MKSFIELSNIAVENYSQNVPIFHKLKENVKSKTKCMVNSLNGLCQFDATIGF